MRLLCIIALSLVSCGGSVVVEQATSGVGGAAGSASDSSGGAAGTSAQCAQDTWCQTYCGSASLTSDRCKQAFGAKYDVVLECDAAPDDCCMSLSDFSPGLTSDCDGAERLVYCCSGLDGVQ